MSVHSEDLPVIVASDLYTNGIPEDSYYRLWPQDEESVEISAVPRQASVEITILRADGLAWEEERTDELEVTWSEVGLNGVRAWLHCACGSRSPRLYVRSGRACCRSCAGLRYRSKNLGPHERARAKADKLRRKLGGEPGLGPLPLPPKGMHSRTYARIIDEILEAEQTFAACLASVIERSAKKVSRLMGLFEDPRALARLASMSPHSEPDLNRYVIDELERRLAETAGDSEPGPADDS